MKLRHLAQRSSLALIALLTAAVPALAQVPEVAVLERIATAERLVAAGQFDAAIEILEAVARDEERDAPRSPTHARALNNLARALAAGGQAARARETAHLALEIVRAEGEPSAGTGTVRCTLAEIAAQAGEHEESLMWSEEAVRDLEAVFGKTPMAAEAREIAGRAALELGREDDARGHLERALAIYERFFGHAHATTTRPLGPLAAIHTARGETERAVELLQAALAILERTDQAFGPAWQGAARQLCDVLGGADRGDEALTVLERICAASLRAQGLAPQARAALDTELAGRMLQLGFPAQAAERFESALRAMERADDDDFARMQCLTWLGRARLVAGDAHAAEQAAGEMLDLVCDRDSEFPDARAAALCLRGRARMALGELGAARVDLDAAFQSAARDLGVAHPLCADALDALVALDAAAGDA